MPTYVTKPHDIQAVQVVDQEGKLRFSETPNWILDRIIDGRIELARTGDATSYFEVDTNDNEGTSFEAQVGSFILLDDDVISGMSQEEFFKRYEIQTNYIPMHQR